MEHTSNRTTLTGAYGPDDPLVNYILGITFEIWEQRGVELIHQYYGDDTIVYALDGIVHGASEMVTGTRAMLESFPDRLLLADDVVWSGARASGYYSSHRITSPMTNLGATRYGPATGKKVMISTIADCVVENGIITREWLMRDNHALCVQLGFDPLAAAGKQSKTRSTECIEWTGAEIDRVAAHGKKSTGNNLGEQLITSLWSGDTGFAERAYAPYVVGHRSPIERYSGREALMAHYESLRAGITVSGVTVDHVATQGDPDDVVRTAIRWAVAGTHEGELLGLPATGKSLFVLGSSHFHVVNGSVSAEWTIFDGMGVLAQLV